MPKTDEEIRSLYAGFLYEAAQTAMDVENIEPVATMAGMMSVAMESLLYLDEEKGRALIECVITTVDPHIDKRGEYMAKVIADGKKLVKDIAAIRVAMEEAESRPHDA